MNDSGGNPILGMIGFWMLMRLVTIIAVTLGGIYALYCLGRAASALERIARASERALHSPGQPGTASGQPQAGVATAFAPPFSPVAPAPPVPPIPAPSPHPSIPPGEYAPPPSVSAPPVPPTPPAPPYGPVETPAPPSNNDPDANLRL